MGLNRRDARELAFSLLYEYSFYTEGDPSVLYERELSLREQPDDDFLRAEFFGTVEHAPELDPLIEKYASGWKTKRMSRVSLAILRLCAYEMLYVDDIPYSVSINEAVELSKKYNDEKAHAFVNGILNALAEHEGVKEKKKDV